MERAKVLSIFFFHVCLLLCTSKFSAVKKMLADLKLHRGGLGVAVHFRCHTSHQPFMLIMSAAKLKLLEFYGRVHSFKKTDTGVSWDTGVSLS